MIINLRVTPNAKKNLIKEEKDRLRVYVNAPAVDGKANVKLIEILAEYFQVKKNYIRIVKGERCREKSVEIL